MSSSGIDLQVHFVKARSEHDWNERMEWDFRSRFFATRLGLDFEILSCAIKGRDSFFVVGGWANPTLAVLMIFLHLLGHRFAIWTDAPNPYRRRGTIKRIVRQQWLKFIFGAATHVMGTGRLALRNLLELGCPEQKFVNFPCGPDLRPYEGAVRRDRFAANDTIVLLSAGRLVNSHKGFDLALHALSELRRRDPRLQIRLRIAGDGPDRVVLEKLAFDIGVRGLVDFLGWLQPSELPAFYLSGHFFVHPAHFEPYGIVIVEAMAAGLIVIASDQTGAAVDRVEHGASGFLHRAGSAEDLANVLSCALSLSSDRLEQMQALSIAAGMAWPSSRAVRVIKELANNS